MNLYTLGQVVLLACAPVAVLPVAMLASHSEKLERAATLGLFLTLVWVILGTAWAFLLPIYCLSLPETAACVGLLK